MQAQKSLSNISANRDLWLAQYRQEVKERDWRSGLAVVEKRGRAEGRREGRAEGERSAKLETARNYLLLGLTPEQVAKGSGLPLSEVRQIAAELQR